MRYILLIALLIFTPNIVGGAVPETNVGNTVGYRWSLAAMGNMIDKYYKEYTGGLPDEKLSLGMLIKMGDLIKDGKHRTKQEIIETCRVARIEMLYHGLACNLNAGCTRKDKPYAKGQMIIPEGEECVAFLDDLVEENKKYLGKNILRSPRTYVQKTVACGGTLYKVVNVVRGKPTDNKIYEVDANNQFIGELGYVTQKNGTFVNETAESKEVTAGRIRGVYNDSYIFLVDVTNKIYDLYSTGRGLTTYSTDAFRKLMPDNEYDFKVSWTRTECDPRNFGFKVTGQSAVAAHTNGVLFKGQVVTLENLGHIITGMIQTDSLAPESAREYAVQRLQGGSESPYANRIRQEAEQTTRNEKDDDTFAKTQTVNPARAYDLARRHMAKKYNLDAYKISCSGECVKELQRSAADSVAQAGDAATGAFKDKYDSTIKRAGAECFGAACTAVGTAVTAIGTAFGLDTISNTINQDDFVSCYYNNAGSTKVVVYKFDDICNDTDKNIPRI